MATFLAGTALLANLTQRLHSLLLSTDIQHWPVKVAPEEPRLQVLGSWSDEQAQQSAGERG